MSPFSLHRRTMFTASRAAGAGWIALAALALGGPLPVRAQTPTDVLRAQQRRAAADYFATPLR